MDIIGSKVIDTSKYEITKDTKKAVNINSENSDTSKIKVVSENALVQGPRYSYDFRNTEKYGKYQYIKLKAF